MYAGREVNGIRLRFEGGAVVDASAETNEAYLLEMLDSDGGAGGSASSASAAIPGSRAICGTPCSTRRSTGRCISRSGTACPTSAATNESRIHWDIVKDLRMPGTRIELDGEVVQQDGAWLL